MRTAMRPRYYCDHCNKGNGSPSAMRRHERGCTANPQRVCGMCAKMRSADAPAPSRDELLQVMDRDGFKAMCEAADNCPACILSALRVRNMPHDDDGPGRVAGPEDGRNEWSYAQAKQAWWNEWNSAQADKLGPYF